jgi:Sodium:sulfate symporter transmembrane region
MRFELSDFEWTAIKSMLPNKTRSVWRVDDRRVLNGICWDPAAAVSPVVLAVGTSIPGLSMPTLTLLCVYSLGLMGVISPYATGPAPMYFGSGYIGKRDFWKFGLILGVIYFAGLLVIVLPWLQWVG